MDKDVLKKVQQAMDKRKQSDFEVGEEILAMFQYTFRRISEALVVFEALNPNKGDAKKKAKANDISSYNDRVRYFNIMQSDLKEQLAVSGLSRAELLAKNIQLDLNILKAQEKDFTGSKLSEQFENEAKIQAKIVGRGLLDSRELSELEKKVIAETIAGVDWTEYIDRRFDEMARFVVPMVYDGIVKGKNSTEYIPRLMREFNMSARDAKALAVTEMARVQTAVQKLSYEKNGIEEYEFISETRACPICLKLDGQRFKVSEMQSGVNACPMHPHCRCSTGGAFDWEVEKKPKKETVKAEQPQEKQAPDIYDGYFRDYHAPENWDIRDFKKALRDEFDFELSDSDAEFTEFALRSAYETFKSFETVYNKLPNKIPYLISGSRSYMQGGLAHYVQGGYSREPFEMALLIDGYQSLEQHMTLVNSRVASGFFSQRKNRNSVLFHEFGHHVDLEMSTLLNLTEEVKSEFSSQSFNRYNQNIFERLANELNDGRTAKDLAVSVSGYARKAYEKLSTRPYAEAFAEIFAEAYGGSPRKEAKVFRQILERDFEEVLGK